MASGKSTLLLDELDVMASVVKDSLYEFLLEFWPDVCAEPYIDNWHIPYLCGELERIARRAASGLPREHDLVVNISPGSTKSLLVSVMFPAWVWTWWPSASFIAASYTYSLAVRLSRMNRMLVRCERYAAAFPATHIIEDQDTKGYFVNVSKGERMCAGIDGDVVGRHADFILIDDPLKPKGARSEAELASANIFIRETLWSRKKDKAVTPTILIMQRLHEDDPTGMMLREFGGAVRHICLPAELTDAVKPRELRRHYVDGLMDPRRLGRAVLDEERRVGEFYYSGQFLQSPVPPSGGMFKAERLRIDTPTGPWTQRVRYWDKGGTRDGGAYTVGVLMGRNGDGRFWVLDVVRGQWDAAEREARIQQTAAVDGKAVIIGIEQEPGSGGKESAEATARRLAGYRVRLDRPTGDKAARADPFAAQVNAGNVCLARGEWNSEYISELTFFPESRYKDQVDASSGAFKLLTRPTIRVGGGFIT